MIKEAVSKLLHGKSASVGVLWYLCGTFLVQGINFILTPVFTNLMTVESYGMLSICAMWFSVFNAFVNSQANGSINNALVVYGKDGLDKYMSTIVWIEIASFSVYMLISLTLRGYLPWLLQLPLHIIYLLIISSFFYNIIQTCLSRFVSEKKHKHYFGLSMLYTVSFVILSITFVVLNENEATKYYGKVYGILVAAVSIGTVAIINIFRKGKFSFNGSYAKFCLSMTLPLVLHSLSQLILGQSDRYMIKLLLENGEYSVGIYSFVYTIGTVINIAWLACNYAWVPWYYERRKKDEEERIMPTAQTYAVLFTAFTSFFLFAVPEAVKILTPANYESGISAIPLIVMGFYFMFLYSFPVNYEFYRRKSGWIAFGTISAGLCNVVLNAALIPKAGIHGAAFATTASYLLLFLFHYLVASKIIKGYDMSFMFFVKYLGAAFAIMAVFYVCIDYAIIRWGISMASLLFGAWYLKSVKGKKA